MAGSAPNVTFVTVTDSVEGKEGGGVTCSPTQDHLSESAGSQLMMFKINLGAVDFKGVRFINSIVAHSLAPLGRNF